MGGGSRFYEYKLLTPISPTKRGPPTFSTFGFLKPAWPVDVWLDSKATFATLRPSEPTFILCWILSATTVLYEVEQYQWLELGNVLLLELEVWYTCFG